MQYIRSYKTVNQKQVLWVTVDGLHKNRTPRQKGLLRLKVIHSVIEFMKEKLGVKDAATYHSMLSYGLTLSKKELLKYVRKSYAEM